MTVKLKPITETSWLVLGDAEDVRIGLLTEMRSEYVLMVKGEKRKFLNRREVNTYFDEDVFENVVDTAKEDGTKKDYFIRGYPVDFDNPHEVFIKGKSLPLFSKKPDSDIYYTAGYYCRKFPEKWVPAFCPKLSTLELHEYIGPFRTELEMKAELAKLKKENTKK